MRHIAVFLAHDCPARDRRVGPTRGSKIVSVLFDAGVNHSGRLPVYQVMAGGSLRLYRTVRDEQEAAMRGQLKAVVIAGAMLTAGLGLGPLAPANAATTPLAINTSGLPCAGGVCSLAEGNVGTAFETELFGTGGNPDVNLSYVWTVVKGSLPAGLTDELDQGTLIGTPTTAGTSSFTVQLSDTAGDPTASQAFTIAIGTGNLDQVTITNATYITGKFHRLGITVDDANTTGVTLTAYITATGAEIGVLAEGSEVSESGQFVLDGIYRGGGASVPAGAFTGSTPGSVTVKSSLGATATRTVTVVQGPKY
jgi:Putative Ig domain